MTRESQKGPVVPIPEIHEDQTVGADGSKPDEADAKQAGSARPPNPEIPRDLSSDLELDMVPTGGSENADAEEWAEADVLHQTEVRDDPHPGTRPSGPREATSHEPFHQALGSALDHLSEGLLLDYVPPIHPERGHRPATPSNQDLPSFVAPPSSQDLKNFPGPDTLPFKMTPPPPVPEDNDRGGTPDLDAPPRIRPELRIPRKAARHALPAPVPGPDVLGIDLGTTNCCAAVIQDGQAFVLASKIGRATTPSAVCFEPTGDVLVGQRAIERSSVDPLHTVVGSKRMMGRPFHSPIVQSIRSHFAYPIVQGEEGEAAVDVDGEIVSLEEVAAYLLRDIRESASLQLGREVTRAVITCPAFYGERQREAVRTAGELAGFKVERVLSEPTAAALNYGYGRHLQTRRVAVYDLGGGTFDVSILEVDGSVYEVLATGGDTFLGGIDFDACIGEMIVDAMVRAGTPDPRYDPSAIARILQHAEEAKKALTERPSTIVELRNLMISGHRPVHLSVPIRRDEADQRLEPLMEQTRRIVHEVCERARISPQDVDDVLLVGGQTRYPAVRQLVMEIFGREPRTSVHPEEAVALGAAQYAASLEAIDNVVLIDALAMPIGVGLPGGRFLKLIEQDTRLPARGSCLLPTGEVDQSEMEVWFFQGEAQHVSEAEPLGTLHIRGLPPRPIGEVTVKVDLRVTEESVLEVMATESATGRIFNSRFATKSTPERLRRRLGLVPKPDPAPAAGRKGQPKSVWRWLTGLFR
ncbi:MAG: Hsp70 family protein [Myxococcota bacterium]